MNTQPHAFETVFTPNEQSIMRSLDNAKQTLQMAYMRNPLVNSIINSCMAEGLFELDQLRVLCANLLGQHEQASQALVNMDNRINYLQATRYQLVQRQIIETWVSEHLRYSRCNDGTVWVFKKVEGQAARWDEVPGLSAMIPQPERV